MKRTNSPTGKYSKKMAKKASRITRWAKLGLFRRIICFLVLIASCAGGLYYGVANKRAEAQNIYDKYIISHDINDLNPVLLSRDSVFNEFENTYLGNSPFQSLMGGYFYENSTLSLFPGNNAGCTIIRINDENNILSDSLVDNINVRENTVFFRNPSNRTIYSYDINSRSTKQLEFEHVGQFVVCGKWYFYVDINDSTLIMYDTTSNNNVVLADNITSFVIAGNSVLYLNKEYEIHLLNYETMNDEIMAINALAFSYNGKLWFQNNNKVYYRNLDEKKVSEYNLGLSCNRLLGITETWIIFESDNRIYIQALDGSSALMVDEKVFVGASDNTILMYSTIDDKYSSYQIKTSTLVGNDDLYNQDNLQELDTENQVSNSTSVDQTIIIEPAKDAPVAQVTIPDKLVYDNTVQTVYDSIAEENNIQAIVMESDGSLTVVANENEPFSAETVSESLRSFIDTDMRQNKLPHFVSVSAEESLTDFKIVLNSVTMNLDEQKAISYVFFMSALYASLEDSNVDNINIDCLNMKGDLLRHMCTNISAD